MKSSLYNAMQPQQGGIMQQLEQFKRQFGMNANPQQILQQALQSGQITQQQINAAYQQAQRMFSR